MLVSEISESRVGASFQGDTAIPDGCLLEPPRYRVVTCKRHLVGVRMTFSFQRTDYLAVSRRCFTRDCSVTFGRGAFHQRGLATPSDPPDFPRERVPFVVLSVDAKLKKLS
jgi:hypothetical protein